MPESFEPCSATGPTVAEAASVGLTASVAAAAAAAAAAAEQTREKTRARALILYIIK